MAGVVDDSDCDPHILDACHDSDPSSPGDFIAMLAGVTLLVPKVGIDLQLVLLPEPPFACAGIQAQSSRLIRNWWVGLELSATTGRARTIHE